MKQWRIMVRIVPSGEETCKKYSVIQIANCFLAKSLSSSSLHFIVFLHPSFHFISQQMNRSNYRKPYKECPIILTRKSLLFSSLIRKCSVSHLLSTSTDLPILSAYRDSPFWIEESLDMSVPVIHLWKTSPCTVWSIYPIKNLYMRIDYSIRS